MTGQAGRRVYVSADMEGITGLVDAEDVQPRGADYERGRVLMTGDVNRTCRMPDEAAGRLSSRWPRRIRARR